MRTVACVLTTPGFTPVRRHQPTPLVEEVLVRKEIEPGAGGSEGARVDLGPLQRFADLPDVTDILVNGHRDLWIDRGDGPVRQPDWSCPDEEHLRALAVRLIALGGRHVDEAGPCCDVRLDRGVRVHVVLPPVSRSGTLISVRLPARDSPSLDDLAERGLFGDDAEAPAVREYVEAAVHRRQNLLITGPAGSGKTTLLAALLARAAPEHRIVALEDVAELRIDHPHVVSLEARQANTEGAGGMDLRRLLREALRMRPDRIVLGECRGAEVVDLFSAMNTGHDGGAGTLHANSLEDVPARIEALGALGGLMPGAVARQAASAVMVVLHLDRRDGRRRLARLAVLLESGVPPGSAWRLLADTGPARSRLPARRTESAILREVSEGYRDGLGAESTLPLVCRGLPLAARSAWDPVADVWRVATEAGAPLAHALDQVAAALRGAADLRRDVGAGLASSRASTTLMLALPPVGLLLSNALGIDAIGVIATTWAGRICLLVALVLLLIGRIWSRALRVRATGDLRCPGLPLLVVMLGVRGGWSLDRARAAAQACGHGAGELALVDAALDLARTAGVPVSGLLSAELRSLRRRSAADGRARVASLAVTSLLPLGVCVLPAFVLVCVVPAVLSLVGPLVPLLS